MDKSEADQIGEALCRWLDSQGVSPSDGTQAMAHAIGAMLGAKASNLVALIEGCHMVYQLINVTALECMANQNKLRIDR